MNPVELSIFASRLSAVADEMGAVLNRSAFSPNIKDRLDYSCAVFDPQGQLCAQAAHIPVHLGSMAFAMRDLVRAVSWRGGDMMIVNDPFLGGTHLPDVTLIAPVFAGAQLLGFVANRAHHADIGAEAPGSMPVSTHLDQEGVVIPPSLLLRGGALDKDMFDRLTGATALPQAAIGDFSAQISANQTGARRLAELAGGFGAAAFATALAALNDYGERIARGALAVIPNGDYRFEDRMDDDGQDQRDIPIRVCIRVRDGKVQVDFAGTHEQVRGNINCPLSVTAAAVLYVFRCLMPDYTPACWGSFRAIELHAPEGCLLHARRPAAVAAGNVETSSRVVDVVLGALANALPERIPAASQGTMNNLAMGARGPLYSWDYYETIGGGMGAGPGADGCSAVQTHMTNTLNTPIEVLEMSFPLRVPRYAVRKASGGEGQYRGGDGIVREFEFLADTEVTLLGERRTRGPWGLAGGSPGAAGSNQLNGQEVPGKASLQLKAGDCLQIATPGGGGWGTPKSGHETSREK